MGQNKLECLQLENDREMLEVPEKISVTAAYLASLSFATNKFNYLPDR
jgi:hypothetical protein